MASPKNPRQVAYFGAFTAVCGALLLLVPTMFGRPGIEWVPTGALGLILIIAGFAAMVAGKFK